MNKQVLSPFDCDMCAMIEDITKQEIEVTASDTSIRLSWAQNGSDGNDTPEAQRIEALKQAIRGRLGDRFIEFFYADGRQSVYMKYAPEEYPEEMRTRTNKSIAAIATALQARTPTAMVIVTRPKARLIAKPRLQAMAKKTFPIYER